ncbi:monoacylglycerol lipase ABHD2-like [Babylonia areolata]|uniref:monoacylglycerol lipase ABHD2-like n=1 Tax=Babylonia areolata TaxID=304850 RepID=UPI003FD0D2FD
MWWWLSTLVALCLYALLRLLNLANPSVPPSIFVKSRHSHFVQALLASCPILREPYVPPLLWGKSGHVQTVVYAKIGRMRDPVPSGSRHTKILQDGSTLTFDIYTPTGRSPGSGTHCMMVCPGFGSSSESSYIRALVTHAQDYGFHVAVLNHLGCLSSLRLTAPRIFSYGGWEEFDIMRQEVEAMLPQCSIIMVGLSMGANIVLKYLGERRQHQRNVCCAFSICQGYNINEAKHLLNKWENMRRAYLYTMTANQRRLIKHHSQVLFAEEVRRNFGFDLSKVFSATTLEDLDKHFSCKLQGYTDVVEYYERHSCSNYIANIDIPLVLLNSEDDPIVPTQLFRHARSYAESHDQALFVTTKHGGHLGYFERGLLHPHPTSWMDRFVCQLASAIVAFTQQQQQRPLEAVTPSPSPETVCPPSLKTNKWLESPGGGSDPPLTERPLEESADLSAGEGTSLRQRKGQRAGTGKAGAMPPTSSEEDVTGGEEDAAGSLRGWDSGQVGVGEGKACLDNGPVDVGEGKACVDSGPMSHPLAVGLFLLWLCMVFWVCAERFEVSRSSRSLGLPSRPGSEGFGMGLWPLVRQAALSTATSPVSFNHPHFGPRVGGGW